MLIPLSIGSLRIACAAARIKIEEERIADQVKIHSECFDRLLEGAIHNGLKPTIDDKAKMSDMAKRDVEHAMEEHPSQYYIKHIDTMLAMADYVDQSDSYAEVVIDSIEFKMLKDHLPLEKKKD